jgi:hypothetical protein
MVPTNLVPAVNLLPPRELGNWAPGQEKESAPMVVWESK